MTIAVIVLGFVALVSAAANAYQLYVNRDSTAGERAALAAEAIATRNQQDAEAQRDAAVIAAARSDAAARGALGHLSAVQLDATAARKELSDREHQALLSGSAADAAAVLARVLATPILPAAGGAGEPAADRAGDGGPPAVPAA